MAREPRISLSNQLAEVLALSANWSARDSSRILDLAAHALPSAVIDWDADAGERWGRLLQGDEVVALVRMDLALAVVVAGFAEALRSVVTPTAVAVIPVATMDGVDFEADEALLDSAFPGRSTSASFDSKAFSIDDLWYVTK